MTLSGDTRIGNDTRGRVCVCVCLSAEIAMRIFTVRNRIYRV